MPYLVFARLGLLTEKKESPQEMTDFLMKMLGDVNKKEHHWCSFFYLTPPVGLEPTTS